MDWAGATIPVYDSTTGQAWPASLFVSVLGASSYTYAEATRDQQLVTIPLTDVVLALLLASTRETNDLASFTKVRRVVSEGQRGCTRPFSFRRERDGDSAAQRRGHAGAAGVRL